MAVLEEAGAAEVGMVEAALVEPEAGAEAIAVVEPEAGAEAIAAVEPEAEGTRAAELDLAERTAIAQRVTRT
jgi:hypothetical protein